MGTKSKPFRAFVEGETISDGRKVTPEMIDECVATFGACDLFAADQPGACLGMQSRAALRRLWRRRRLARADQKPFPSVELTPNYAGSGKFGIIGLAFTDPPASIGTERLQFSHRSPGTIFASGADPVAIEFEAKLAEQEKVDGIVDRLFAAVGAKFKPAERVTPAPANHNFDPAAFATDMRTAFSGSLTAALKPVTEAHASLQRDFATLKTKLATTEQPGFSRAPASGEGDDAVTDC